MIPTKGGGRKEGGREAGKEGGEKGGGYWAGSMTRQAVLVTPSQDTKEKKKKKGGMVEL